MALSLAKSARKKNTVINLMESYLALSPLMPYSLFLSSKEAMALFGKKENRSCSSSPSLILGGAGYQPNLQEKGEPSQIHKEEIPHCHNRQADGHCSPD